MLSAGRTRNTRANQQPSSSRGRRHGIEDARITVASKLRRSRWQRPIHIHEIRIVDMKDLASSVYTIRSIEYTLRLTTLPPPCTASTWADQSSSTSESS